MGRTFDLTPSLLARYWAKVDTSGGPDACWPWTGSRRPFGYGQIASGGHNGQPIKAHRVAFAIATGEWPEAVLHRCDFPPCCNPRHLFAGDQTANNADMRAKGRQASGPSLSRAIKERIPRGQDHYSNRLTAEQQAEMIELYASGAGTQVELAERFGVSGAYASRLMSAAGFRRGKRPVS